MADLKYSGKRLSMKDAQKKIKTRGKTSFNANWQSPYEISKAPLIERMGKPLFVFVVILIVLILLAAGALALYLTVFK